MQNDGLSVKLAIYVCCELLSVLPYSRHFEAVLYKDGVYRSDFARFLRLALVRPGKVGNYSFPPHFSSFLKWSTSGTLPGGASSRFPLWSFKCVCLFNDSSVKMSPPFQNQCSKYERKCMRTDHLDNSISEHQESPQLYLSLSVAGAYLMPLFGPLCLFLLGKNKHFRSSRLIAEFGKGFSQTSALLVMPRP